MRARYAPLALFVVAVCLSGAARAETAVGLRAGTLGVGLDLDFELTEKLNLRVGYSAFSHDDTVEDTDVVYDGELKLGNAMALLDWHVFGGGFRISAGAVGGGTKVNLVGKPTGGTFEIGDEVFAANQVGSLKGKLELGSSVAPYVGIGWGNTVDAEDRITFLFDIGAIYAGTPDVNLSATCAAAAPVGSAACNRLQTAVQTEEDELSEDATQFEWYPVLSLGIAVRF